MLTALRQRLNKDESGFTLIELMVVVLIIAILIAIAIPTFLGAQDRARDRGAQSDLRNAVTAAKTIATDQAGLFKRDATNAINAAALLSAEGALSFTDTATGADVGLISVVTAGDGTSISLLTESASGKFFQVVARSDGSVGYCAPTSTTHTAVGSCTGAKW
jgi:type IV pilus assembly protein PilA